MSTVNLVAPSGVNVLRYGVMGIAVDPDGTAVVPRVAAEYLLSCGATALEPIDPPLADIVTEIERASRADHQYFLTAHGNLPVGTLNRIAGPTTLRQRGDDGMIKLSIVSPLGDDEVRAMALDAARRLAAG